MRPTYSIGTLALVCVLIGVAASYFKMAATVVLFEQENLRLKKENKDIVSEFGSVLVIDDPALPYSRKLRSTDTMTWRFRIYLPPGQMYRVRTEDGNGKLLKRDVPFTLAISAVKSDLWNMRVAVDEEEVLSLPIGDSLEKWLSQQDMRRLVDAPQKEHMKNQPIPLITFPKNRLVRNSWGKFVEKPMTISLVPVKSNKKSRQGTNTGIGLDQLPGDRTKSDMAPIVEWDLSEQEPP